MGTAFEHPFSSHLFSGRTGGIVEREGLEERERKGERERVPHHVGYMGTAFELPFSSRLF